MGRRTAGDRVAWQALRRDVRSNVAVLAIVVAGIACLLLVWWVVLGVSRVGDRSTPLYWVLLVPFAWWAASVASFTPWALRLVRPGAVVVIVVSVVAAGLALRDGSGVLAPLGAAVSAVVGAALALVLYSGSLAARLRG